MFVSWNFDLLTFIHNISTTTVYQQTQEQCSGTAKKYQPLIKTLLLKSLDIQSIVNKIKISSSNRESVEDLWEELKVSSFARVCVSVYAITIMNLIIRIQITIMSRNSFSEGKEYTYET